MGEHFRSEAPQDEAFILNHLTKELKSLRIDKETGVSTNSRTECENDSNLIGYQFLSENLRYLEHIKAKRGLSSHGHNDPGVHHPAKNRVKKDPEDVMMRDMYL